MDEFKALREQMVVNQVERRGVKDARVLKAMCEFPGRYLSRLNHGILLMQTTPSRSAWGRPFHSPILSD